MYAEGKAVTVGKERLAAKFEDAMCTAEQSLWGTNDIEGLFDAERWLSYLKGLIEVKSWDKSELEKAKKNFGSSSGRSRMTRSRTRSPR